MERLRAQPHQYLGLVCSFHSRCCCNTFQLKWESSLLLVPSPCDRKLHLACRQIKCTSLVSDFESGLLFIVAWFGLPTAHFW